jgi:exopolysaccharide production protein ExoZ
LWLTEGNHINKAKMALNNLQVLRAFAALNVVYFHIIVAAKSYSQPVYFFSIFEGWGENGVDIFFVISGFVIVYTQSVREKNALDFLKRRILRIVPIYWFLTICLLLLYLALPSAFREYKPDLTQTVYSFLFLSGSVTSTLPLLLVGWTLEYEMLFYVLFCIGILLGKKLTPIIFSTAVLSILVITGLIGLIAIEFILGMLCAKLYLSGVLKKLAISFLIVALGWFVATIFFKIGVDRLFLYGVPSFILIFALAHIRQAQNKLLIYLGDASYSIYLVQFFTIFAFYKASSELFPTLNGDLLSILALIASGGFGCFFYQFIEKPLVNYLKDKVFSQS